MKVLHINCNYIGTTLHQTMVEHMDKLGVESSVFVPTYDRNTAAIQVNDNVLVSECFRKWDRAVFDYKQKKIWKAVESNYEVSSFDLVHAYTLFTDGNAAMHLKEKYGLPYVVAVRNTDVNDFFRYMVHLRSRGVKILQQASAIFFLSKTYKKQVFDNYVPEKLKAELEAKTHIIPNGIDDFWIENGQTRDEKKAFDDRLKIVYAGRIDANKNIETTQKAVDILRAEGRNIAFTVVGKVIDENVFQRVQSDENTKYIPAQPKEELIKLYRANDIFVMPSFKETFGLVYAEAMTQGLPVVYTKGQGFDGQFPDGEVGYAVNPNDAGEVADAIRRICENYSVISRNSTMQSKNFVWDDICAGYLEIYRKILR